MVQRDPNTPAHRYGGIFLIIGWILGIGLFSALLHQMLYAKKEPVYTLQGGKLELTLPRARDGHFYLTAKINGITTDFMIDTGATLIAIPENQAKQAKLKSSHPITLNTANGTTTGYLTQIKQFTLDTVHFSNIKAVIIPDTKDDTGLLGMNFLQNFEITQNSEMMQLTLTKQ